MIEAVEILQKARKAKGLSQEALADKLKLSHRMYQRYEEGKFPKYKAQNIKKIDQFLGTNIYDIIYGDKNEQNVSRYQVIKI